MDDNQVKSRGRALALDLGDRRIGVAVCDAERTVATPYETITRVGNRPVEHDRIAAIAEQLNATMIVVGMPLSLDGTVGPRARQVASEVKALRKRFEPLGIDVTTHDERHSTTQAQQSLTRAGVGNKKGRAVVDQLAAAVILQGWIDANR